MGFSIQRSCVLVFRMLGEGKIPEDSRGLQVWVLDRRGEGLKIQGLYRFSGSSLEFRTRIMSQSKSEGTCNTVFDGLDCD